MERFKGIKFASAKRFGHPIPEKDIASSASLDHLDCKEVMCPQPLTSLCKYYGSKLEQLELSEDCLRLSVFTPDRNGSYPVLIWIHGGSYMTGSGQYHRYEASAFAESENIVFVSISYRLGMFGFQNGNALAMEDQVCAIEWIQRNIHFFGGDSSNVTVMGQSAGAHSIIYHIATAKKSLFSKAIIISAPFLEKSRKSMQHLTDKFIAALPCPPSEASIDQILKAQDIASHSPFPGMPIAPVLNKITAPDHIIPGLEKVMLIYQQDETVPFVPKPLAKLIKNFAFVYPAKKYARHLRKKGIETTVIERTWGHDFAKFGAIHFMETPLLMGDWKLWKISPCMDGIPDAEYEAESARFRKFIGDFVKSGIL